MMRSSEINRLTVLIIGTENNRNTIKHLTIIQVNHGILLCEITTDVITENKSMNGYEWVD
jgi:hypothetical protein